MGFFTDELIKDATVKLGYKPKRKCWFCKPKPSLDDVRRWLEEVHSYEIYFKPNEKDWIVAYIKYPDNPLDVDWWLLPRKTYDDALFYSVFWCLNSLDPSIK